jgi:hypothetical protein
MVMVIVMVMVMLMQVMICCLGCWYQPHALLRMFRQLQPFWREKAAAHRGRVDRSERL